MKHMQTIVALFEDIAHAQDGVEALRAEDVEPSRIGLLAAPASGPLLAMGRLRSAMTSCGSVAAVLEAVGVPDVDALRYAAALRSGKTLVVATVGAAKMERVVRALARSGPLADAA